MRRLKRKIAALIIAELLGKPIPAAKVGKKFPNPPKAKPRSVRSPLSKRKGVPKLQPLPQQAKDADRRSYYYKRQHDICPRKVAGTNYVCVRCRRAQRGNPNCGVCKREMQHAGIIARTPRKAASDKVWRTFCEQFHLKYERRA